MGNKIITILVEVVIFTSIIGVIAGQIAGVINPFNATANITGASAILMGVITLFVVIGFVVALLKTMGIVGR